MSDISLVQAIRELAQQELPPRHLLTHYLTHPQVTERASAREILDFRLCDHFLWFVDCFRSVVAQLRLSSSECGSDSGAGGASEDLAALLRVLLLVTADYDLSFQFGDYGGHALLKQCQRLGTLPIHVENMLDEVIGTVLDSGVQFPLPTSTSHKESVVKPLTFDFRVKPVILTGADEDGIEMQETMRVYVRQVPAGMHGAGQATVGYVMWSSAVILSRWLALNVSLFKGKRILEIGAGNALCGVTIASFASHVTLSDFNEIVLNNIDSIVEINSGEYQMTHCSDGISSSCLGDNNDRIEVCRLDWNKLLPASCTPSDASSTCLSSSDVVASKYRELTDQSTTPDRVESSVTHQTYDVIIASDIVCCESDSVGVTHTLLNFLKREDKVADIEGSIPVPVAIFVVPSAFHRYGVKNLISTILSAGLVVHWRYISSSKFCNNAYSDSDQAQGEGDLFGDFKNQQEFNVAGCEECVQLREGDSDTSGESSRAPTCCRSCEGILYNQTALLDTFRYTTEDDYLTNDLAEAPYYKWLFMIIHWKHPV